MKAECSVCLILFELFRATFISLVKSTLFIEKKLIIAIYPDRRVVTVDTG